MERTNDESNKQSFFLLPFHIESIASTILCIVSRFLADLALFRLPKNEKLCKNEGSVQSFFYWLGLGLFYCFTLMMS